MPPPDYADDIFSRFRYFAYFSADAFKMYMVAFRHVALYFYFSLIFCCRLMALIADYCCFRRASFAADVA